MWASHVRRQAEMNQFRIAHAISNVYGVATDPFHRSRQSDSSPPEINDWRNLGAHIALDVISDPNEKIPYQGN